MVAIFHFLVVLMLVMMVFWGDFGACTASINQVVQAIAQRKYDEAISLCDSMLLQGGDTEQHLPYYYKATAEWSKGYFEGALDNFSKCIIRSKSTYEPAFLQRGKLYLRRGLFKEAMHDFDVILKLNPGDVDASAAKIQTSKAASQFEALLLHVQHREHAKILEITRELLLVCNMCAKLFIIDADAKYALQNYDLALISYRNAANLDKDHKIFMKIAKINFNLGKLEPGLDRLRDCVHLYPDEPRCSALYHHIRKLQKKWDGINGAVKSKKLLELKDGLKDLQELKEKISSQTWYDAELPQDQVYHSFFVMASSGLCHEYVRVKDVAKAKEWCEKALADAPDDIQVITGRVEAFLLAEDYDAARRFVESKEAVFSGDSDISAKLAALKKKIDAELAKPTDYYKELELKKGESDQRVIKKAYYRLAQLWHPDRHESQEDKDKANVKMAKVNKAYEVLSDVEAKRKYDQFDIDPNNPHQAAGTGGGHPFAGGFDMGDIFSQFMGGGGGGHPFGGGGGNPFGAGGGGAGGKKKKGKKQQAGGHGFPFGAGAGAGNPFGNFNFHFDL